ncbi:MAG: class I SAM-dependent methyltransferase, partial [Bacteroidia bacterium]
MTNTLNEDIDKFDFDRSKIYEELKYDPAPPNYSGQLPWIVQQQIAATNGVHYVDRIGKLNGYPQYELPLPSVKSGLMLDIGNGWGRWLVAGANKGYIPIGIDLRLEFCKVAMQTLQDNKKNGYTVVADLKNLPFRDNIFDLVWSFSVIQHTHRERLLSCLGHINRILSDNGFTFLEFPNKNGIRNRFTNVEKEQIKADDYNSWCVRYYTPDEYKQFFLNVFSNFSFRNHSFLGIGILPEDMKYVSAKNKIICIASLLGSFMTKLIPFMKYCSDSIYIKANKKQATSGNTSI